MQFTINTAVIINLLSSNSFTLLNAEPEIVFIGLRGCLPVQPDNNVFSDSHELRVADVDYRHPRCTICQWRPKTSEIATFAASTVPHLKYVGPSVKRNGEGCNELMTGFYLDYRKGVHKAGSPTAHKAFRETGNHPIRRTADDYDFDNDDRVDFANPCDNIHAGWSMGIDHPDFASAGCQVIVGYPTCPQRGDLPAAGPWKTFRDNAYAIAQDRFPYALFYGSEAFAAAQPGAYARKLRFGSRGAAVSALQEALKAKLFYEGNVDEDFGVRTLRAVLAYQTATFGPGGNDGIVGKMTAAALGLSL